MTLLFLSKNRFSFPSRPLGFSRRSGFTLVEVVITVFLLATVISISVPSLLGMRDQQLRLQCLSNLRQLQSAKDAYVLDHLGEGSPTDDHPDRQAVFRSYFVEGFTTQTTCPLSQNTIEGVYDVYFRSVCPVCGDNEMGLPPELPD